MSVYQVKIQAMVTETYRVIAENEQEAASKAELMFRNDNAPEIVAKSFQVKSDSSSHQSPVTSHQSPVTSHQSPVTSHQSPVTCYSPSREMSHWGSQRQAA